MTLAAAPLLHAGGEIDDRVIHYQVEEEFDYVKENIAMAITDRGMIVSGTLHVSAMMQRTGADLGFTDQVYQIAESLEFCSTMMSHRMTRAHPANITVCPFTVSIYVEADKPETVNIAFRRPNLLGNQPEVEEAVFNMLNEIARAGLE
ncbi:hypothetical protein BOW53_09550 [Solemya pervernicosa gill symbiont]|uniref:DUF302 domain-containing protein n=1 Tax=Solemya pervernicosa gill symbiont TaxID=642797 RepID=A0A1T2L4F3_9GAMM|nr:hypothetical protein BOW53_09550 [Solemya pervernicosa gill symbiont]